MNDSPLLLGFDFPEDDYQTTSVDYVDANNWAPTPGPLFTALASKMRSSFARISRNPESTFLGWSQEVTRVASRCLSPAIQNAQRAQLVFGRVQAGKTSNFTGLISLLADNNYDLFIVLAGINLNLRTQTFDRLVKDLDQPSNPKFEIIASNTALRESQEAQRITNLITTPADPDPFESQFRRKLVYVVLKEDDNLNWMNRILSKVKDDFVNSDALDKTSVLIIDDEVDQASPDTHTNDAARTGAIHEAIAEMRSLLSTHTYAGYTATPYANLLMEDSSRLKCEVVTALEPGPDYVGPEHLFAANSPHYGSVIDDWNWQRQSIPPSLREAFAEFVVQASVLNGPPEIRALFIQEPFLSATQGITPASMLVQPHQKVEHASKIFEELERLHSEWVMALETPTGPNGERDISYGQLWSQVLNPALAAFGFSADTVSASFRRRIETILRRIQIREINGPGKAKGFEFPTDREFANEPAWVLIGGQLLDRGQTLPNLVQTYMPRPPGGASNASSTVRGNIDTIQQRGRFYGQRGQYRDLLRGRFDSDTLDTYTEIARIEPINISAIQRLDRAGLGIEKMLMVIDLGEGSLRAASSNKIPRSTQSLSNSTWLFRQVFYTDNSSSISNAKLLTEVLSKHDLTLVASEPLKRRSNFVNARIEIPTEEAIEFLTQWSRTKIENTLFLAAVELLKNYRDLGHATVDLHLMSRPVKNLTSMEAHSEYRSARPSLITLPDGSLSKANQITGLTSSNDSRFLVEKRVGIQIHYFDMNVNSSDGSIARIPDCIGLGVAFPDRSRFSIYNGG